MLRSRNKIKNWLKTLFSEKNIRKMIIYCLFISITYFVFLLFAPMLPQCILNKISRGSGYIVIATMLLVLCLLVYSFTSIKGFIFKFGIIGAIGTIIMYALWLAINYGAKHPHTSEIGFNASEITFNLSCAYLLLERQLFKK